MEKADTLSYAKKYLLRGFSVIPLQTRSKKPALSSWREYQERLPTGEELEAWFGNMSQNNIGIVAGKVSGLAVVDFDTPEAVQFAKDNHFPKTPLVKTGKGYHAYYLYRDGVRNFQKRDDLPGIDLRGDGGYVVAPPSIHESGEVYQWIEGQCLEDLPFADLPETLLAKTGLDKTPIRTLLEDGAVMGQRNDGVARIAGALFAKGLNYDESLSLCLAWNQRNSPPLPEKEVKATIESIFKRHLRNHGVENESSPAVKEMPDIKHPSMAPISLKELFAKPEMAVLWLVEGILPAGGLSGIVGKPKTGKTTLARQEALAIARGDDFLGRKTQQGPVVFYALEEKESEIKKHFLEMGAVGDEPIYCYSGGAAKDAIEQIGAAIKEIRPVLVIVDPLFRLVRVKDGNDYAQMTQAIEPILRMARDTGAHLQFVHHAPKAEREEAGDAVLGSTAIFASVDTLLLIKRHEIYRTIQTVQRYGDDIPETTLVFDKESRTITLGGGKEEADLNGAKEAITDYLSKRAEPVTEASIGADVEGRTALKRKALRALVAEERIIRYGKGGRKDPFRYALPGVPDVPAVPDVPGEAQTREQESFTDLPAGSCSTVPSIPLEIGNSKQEKPDGPEIIEKSSCSQNPEDDSCSQEEFDLLEGEF